MLNCNNSGTLLWQISKAYALYLPWSSWLERLREGWCSIMVDSFAPSAHLIERLKIKFGFKITTNGVSGISSHCTLILMSLMGTIHWSFVISKITSLVLSEIPCLPIQNWKKPLSWWLRIKFMKFTSWYTSISGLLYWTHNGMSQKVLSLM
jgi:hypothetical protein